MDYKWNIYTCDVEYEYNEQYKKNFKWFDNWVKTTENITDALRKRYQVYVISDSEESARILLEHKIGSMNSISGIYSPNGHRMSQYCHYTRNEKVLNLRIIKLSISTLLEHYDSESVIEWMKERGISTVMAK